MDMDLAYANAAFIPGAAEYPPRWAAKAAGLRGALGARAQHFAYGPKPRQGCDLFLPEGTLKGLMIFIHGGYWVQFDPSQWSHLAAGALARGWACAMPGYTLAPEVRVHEITAEIAEVTRQLAQRVAGPVVVTGHSAGGHLAARMGCTDQAVAVARVVPISPLADLAPLALTKMQEKLRLDPTEITAESPARQTLRPETSAHVWVGGQERPSFLWHARLLSEAWGCGWTVSPGKHHFNIVEDLETPESDLMSTLLDGL